MLALGTGGSIFAGDEGIDRKVLKEVDSNIPGFAKLRIRDTIFQPGAVLSERTMANPMICEVTQGTLEVTVDGKTFTAQQGDFWTCRAGGTEADANCSGLQTLAPKPATKGHFRLTFRANKRRLGLTIAANEPPLNANSPQTAS